MKRLLLAGTALLALGAVALAQVNVVPQIGVATGVVNQPTYSAVSIALAPASAATDIFCISGSTTKSISVKRISITGTATTLNEGQFTLLRRVSLDTGGTPASGTALPVAAKNNPNDGAAVAVLTAYTANPTIVDSSPTYLRTSWLTTPITTSVVINRPIIWLAGQQVDSFSRAFDIPAGVTGQICVNMNATTISGGKLDIDITWTEN